MQIPVFVSVGSRLSSEQVQLRDHLYHLLREMSLDLRTVGTSDYPSDNPLREVSVLASIVEKETAKANEMPVVAGLYLNRLLHFTYPSVPCFF